MITTHVLDTALGKPGKGIAILVQAADGQILGAAMVLDKQGEN